jgi:hypothetical protein
VLWWIAVLRWVLCSVFVALICDCGDTVQVHAVYNKQMWFQLELVRFLLRIPDALRHGGVHHGLYLRFLLRSLSQSCVR